MSPIASKLILTLYNSKVLEATDKLEDAKAWATEILGDQNSAKYYLSQENFVVAYKNNDSFSFLIDRDSLYSQMYGPNAYFDDRCLWLSVTGSETDLAGKMKRGRGFQFWEVLTSKNNVPIELIDDAQEINAIIDEHAPDSSVRPGDPEELFWGGIRNELGELAALAVLVKWQSGFHVMASVATRSQDREKGYGPIPAETLSHGSVPILETPLAREFGRSQFVVSAFEPPNQGNLTCPPWVCPAKITSS